jgi:hypothetical protein
MKASFARIGRALVSLAAICGAVVVGATPTLAKPKDACSILTIGDLQRQFPGAAIAPPDREGIGGCRWSASSPSGDESKIAIRVRYDDSIRWPMDLKTEHLPDPVAFRMLSGLGTESFYSQIDGVFFRKAGFVVQVSLIEPAGALATAPREIALARFVASRFEGMAL